MRQRKPPDDPHDDSHEQADAECDDGSVLEAVGGSTASRATLAGFSVATLVRSLEQHRGPPAHRLPSVCGQVFLDEGDVFIAQPAGGEIFAGEHLAAAGAVE